MAMVIFNSTAEWRLTAAGGCAAVWQLILCSDDVHTALRFLKHITDSLWSCAMIFTDNYMCKKVQENDS